MLPFVLATMWMGLSATWGAAVTQAPSEPPACHYGDPPGTVRTVPLAGGFVVELRRVPDPDAAEEACILRVLDRAGGAAIERSGFGARILPPVGGDLDADGVLDVVLSVDQGGGNRCCWNTIVLSLSSPPRLRAETPESLGWQFDARRRRFVAAEVVPFYDLGPDMASAPIAIRLHRLGSAGLVDVTREYCDELLDPVGRGAFSREDDFRYLTPERREASVASAGDAFANEQTRLMATSLAVQFHICGRSRGADALIDDVFPVREAAEARRRIANATAAMRRR